jgi:hypothetical protein
MTVFPIESFRLVTGAPNEEAFGENPLWSEYYDYDEREEIASWGVDRAWLDDELRRLPDHPHPSYPVLHHEPFPADHMRLFIHARFRTPRNHELRGYLVNHPPHAIGLFGGGEEWVISRHPLLARERNSSLESVRQFLGDPTDPIMPLSFQSVVRGPDGEPIHGIFGE